MKNNAGKMLTKLRPDMKAWNAMSEEDRVLLTKLGIKPKKTKRAPVARATKDLKPYDVIATVICGLCHVRTMEYLRMTPINFSDDTKGEPHLRSTKLKSFREITSPFKRENHPVPYCKKCKEILMEQSKEELIEALIEYARAVSCSWNRR